MQTATDPSRWLSTLCGLGDRQEVLGLQAGAANQAAADMRHGEQRCGIGRTHRAAVEDADPLPRVAKLTDELLTDEGVHGRDVLFGGGLAGADSPDWFIRH